MYKRKFSFFESPFAMRDYVMITIFHSLEFFTKMPSLLNSTDHNVVSLQPAIRGKPVLE